MAEVVLSKVNKHYGSVFHAVKDVDLAIADREFVALVGPSGCGKSTTLRMIAGLEDISSGEIRIGERVVNHLPPRDRDVAMVFQNYALYQHMSVYDNLAFGLRNKKMPEAEIKAAIDRAAEMLGLHELLKRRPRQLSGGPVAGGQARGHGAQQPDARSVAGKAGDPGRAPRASGTGWRGRAEPHLRGQGRGGRAARLGDPAGDARRRGAGHRGPRRAR